MKETQISNVYLATCQTIHDKLSVLSEQHIEFKEEKDMISIGVRGF